MIILLSNQIEELLVHLKEELASYLRQNPLGDAWIVVPSSTMKEYIRAFLLETMGIAAGVRFVFLSELFPLSGLAPLPSKLCLSLTIEQKIQADFKERKKIIAFSDALADQFLLSLEEGKRPKEEWIETLFRDLYSIEKKGERRRGKLFLFGFSHIPPLYWKRIEAFDALLYHLSPCRSFWSDLLTDRQRFRELEKVKGEVQEEFDFYFTEGNALLRNFGLLPRLFARTIEEKELITNELYVTNEDTTLLAMLQNDLLDMEERKLSPDDSLTIHAVSTPLREVEVLRELLVKAFQEEPSLLPSEVKVYVTDLSLYAPLISFVFGEKSQIPYAVIGAQETTLEESLEAFLFLLSFGKGEWSIEEIEELFGFSPLLTRFGIREEERETLLHWLRKAGSRIGFAEGETSWKSAFDRLLRGLAFEEEENGDARAEVSFTEAELLGRAMLLLTSLATDLLPIRGEDEREYSEWLAYFRSLVLGYLPAGEEREKVETALTFLEESAPLYGGKFSFLSMERVVSSLRQKGKRGGLRALLGTVCFSPLEVGGLIPAKRIFVLGCDEESLPKAETKTPFSSFSLHREEQRTLFLELLLSAREKLAFMYSRLTKEGEERRSSPFFADLFEVIGKIPSTEHPLHSFALPRVQEKEKDSFFAPCSLGQKKRGEISLSIATLSRFARHPLRHYLREGLQLGLQGDPMEEYLSFEFSLPPYIKQELRRKGMEASWEEFVQDAFVRGKLPSGGIKKGVLAQLQREIREEKQALMASGIDPKELFALTLSDEYRGEKTTASLTLPLPEGRIAKISGILPNLSPKGLFLSGKGDVSDWIKQWPLILVYSALVQKEENLPSTLIFSEEAEQRSLPTGAQASEWLAQYVLFYERALENPSLFLPDWGKYFLEEKAEEFAKKVKSGPGAGLGYEDVDWEWVRQKGGFSDPHLLFAAQQAELTALFSGPYRFWKGEPV